MTNKRDEKGHFVKGWKFSLATTDEQRESRRLSGKKYREVNREKVREYARQYAQAWRKTHPEEYKSRFRAFLPKQLARRNEQLERLAGRTKPAVCEVCGGAETIAFDHNHTTGKFRGWICSPCNKVLGFSRDNPDVLRKLAIYLENDLQINEKVTVKEIINQTSG